MCHSTSVRIIGRVAVRAIAGISGVLVFERFNRLEPLLLSFDLESLHWATLQIWKNGDLRGQAPIANHHSVVLSPLIKVLPALQNALLSNEPRAR